jgi:hypothetical protein
MPGVRSKGQIMIGCWCETAFVEKIDRARGWRTRSHFCRDAIAEKLRTMGIKVPEQEVAAPDRAGKGGPKRTIYRVAGYRAELNETAPTSGVAVKHPPKKGMTPKSGAK